VVLLALVCLGLWAAVIEPRYLVVRERTLRLPHWPEALSGMRVALVGDLHVGAMPMDRPRLREVLRRTTATRPDLILFLGDLVDTKSVLRRRIPPEALRDDLPILEAPLGVYGVLGNHDWWFGGPRVRRGLEAGGVEVLENDALPLTFRGERFWLLGVGDDFTDHDDLRRTLDAAGPGPRLIMTHSPDLFPLVPEDVSLTVAAHTHGGQVRIPFYGPAMVPSKYGSRYAWGHFEEEGRQLWVTSGVGTSLMPVRFGVPPEVVVLRLEPRE